MLGICERLRTIAKEYYIHIHKIWIQALYDWDSIKIKPLLPSFSQRHNMLASNTWIFQMIVPALSVRDQSRQYKSCSNYQAQFIQSSLSNHIMYSIFSDYQINSNYKFLNMILHSSNHIVFKYP